MMSILLSGLKSWRVGLLMCLVIAMLCTPADPVSMLLFAVPLCGIYAMGMIAGMMMQREAS